MGSCITIQPTHPMELNVGDRVMLIKAVNADREHLNGLMVTIDRPLKNRLVCNSDGTSHYELCYGIDMGVYDRINETATPKQLRRNTNGNQTY